MHLHIDRSFTDERFGMCNLLMRFDEGMKAILKFIFFVILFDFGIKQLISSITTFERTELNAL